MFRILGFVVGSIVSIAALVMLVGMPNFHLTESVSDEDRYGAAIRQLKEKRQTLAQAAESTPGAADVEPIPTVPPVAVSSPPLVEETVEDTADDEAVGETTTASSGIPEHAPFPAAPAPEFAFDDASPPNVRSEDLPLQYASNDSPTEAEWQAFWNPFRSEIAARGFVQRLEDVTGLDYRVAKVKNGVYQVAFSYSNDAERSSKLSQISAATGLDLSDSMP